MAELARYGAQGVDLSGLTIPRPVPLDAEHLVGMCLNGPAVDPPGRRDDRQGLTADELTALADRGDTFATGLG